MSLKNEFLQMQLEDAIKKEKYDDARSFLKRGATPNTAQLRSVVEKGHLAFARDLLDGGAKPDKAILQLAMDKGYDTFVHILSTYADNTDQGQGRAPRFGR